jgi:hypothetical protein
MPDEMMVCAYCGIDLVGWPCVEVIDRCPGVEPDRRFYCNIGECLATQEYGGTSKTNMRRIRQAERADA